MAIAFVRNIVPWANVSPSTSASFTPTAGDQLILVAQGGGSSIASFSGTGAYSMLTPPGSFLDLNSDPWATGVNLSATAGAQTATETAGSVGDAVWGVGIEYSGVASATSSEVTRAAPGTLANAISGTAVTVPTGSKLLAFCANTSQDAATITTSGTNRGNTQGDFSGGFCWAEYAGAGAAITPKFTTTVGGDNYVVIQWLLTPSGGSGAALASTPTDTTSATGALSTGIDIAATPSDTANASGTLSGATAAWETWISQPIGHGMNLTDGRAGGFTGPAVIALCGPEAPNGSIVQIFPITAGTSGTLTINDCSAVADATEENQIFSLAFSEITSNVPIEVNATYRTGLCISSVPTGMTYAVLYDGPGGPGGIVEIHAEA